jgi:beta-phosphoglucomutase-like phosphatase (HAD superfamily)
VKLKVRFDLVIFDWAGTMVDFGCVAPVKALLEAFSRDGVEISEAAARRDMGKTKLDHVRGLLSHPEVDAAWRARPLNGCARRVSGSDLPRAIPARS